MSFILGSLTLPNPKSMARDFLEVSQTNMTIQNKTTRRVVTRKEVYTLIFRLLSASDVDSILSIYNLQQVVDFQITDTNLAISATSVLIDFVERGYPKTGKEYRSNVKLVLTEVF